MEELLTKISSCNIFNNLVPGAVFVSLLNFTGTYTFDFKSIVIELATYYFIGMIISRVGSIVVEPILKKMHIIKFSSYIDYVSASSIDDKIDVLSESNNLYRTIVAALGLFIILFAIIELKEEFEIPANWITLPIVIIVFFMFVISYRKQSGYISNRISAVLSRNR